MKNNILYTVLFSTAGLLWTSCTENDFSKDYDIEFPVATLSSISKNNPYIEDVITLYGENLSTVKTVAVSTYRFDVSTLEVAKDEKSATIKVPRLIETGTITLTNKYDRAFESDIHINPSFYPVKNVVFPSEIQSGKAFMLEGENMDLIKEVKIDNVTVSSAGAPSPELATYATRDLNLVIGSEVKITITPKDGGSNIEGSAKVIAPVNTYVPKSSLLIFDTNGEYVIEEGNDYGTAIVNKAEEGMFGKALRVSATTGNGWNGTYLKIYGDNNGEGYDLSNYNDPHITMLINTYGKHGYMQPMQIANGNEQDVHLYGNKYNDDYYSVTDGWEWRSYSLSDLGFNVSTGFIDKMGVQFRGGNIGNSNDLEFDIAVNKVMITDGPLNPKVVWDFEESGLSLGDFVVKTSGDGGLKGINEGNKFASFTKTIKEGWNWMTDFTQEIDGLDDSYSNGIWINFLMNTGNNYAYFQLEYGQNGGGLGWFNFTPDQGYGDDYKFESTNNEWVWRSVRLSDEKLDIASPFYFKVGATTGNWETGTYELNLDYFVITTTPLDASLNTETFK